MGKREQLDRYLLWIFTIIIGIMSLNQVVRYIPGVSLNFEFIYRVTLLVACLMIFVGLRGRIYSNSVNKLLLFLMICMIISDICNGISILDSIISILWVVAFLYGDVINNRTSKLCIKTSIAVFLLLIMVTSIAVLLNYKGSIYDRTNIIGVNYAIYFSIPLLVILQRINKPLIWECVTFSILMILSIISFKRTTLMALALAAFLYFYSKYMARSNFSKRRKFVIIVCIGVITGVAALWYTDGYIIERISVALETGGNGRLDIWSRVVDQYIGSNVIELLVGHGYNAVYRTIGLSAHNEFLEMLYDYGIIGLVIYMAVLLKFIAILYQLRQKKNFIYPVALYAFTILIVISIFSHIQLYTYVGIPVYFFMGHIFSFSRHMIGGQANEIANCFMYS